MRQVKNFIIEYMILSFIVAGVSYWMAKIFIIPKLDNININVNIIADQLDIDIIDIKKDN